MQIEKRNKQVKNWLNTQLDQASKQDTSAYTAIPHFGEVDRALTELIEVQAKGFRGVVITALAGRHLDPGYSPFENFYACNPRSIFENAIWNVLDERNIPCGKSDPLNVAKNIQVLDATWAKARRPEASALAAVYFLERVFRTEDQNERALLESCFFHRLLHYAARIASHPVADSDTAAVSRQYLANQLIRFSLEAPESGATPQLLVAQLLQQLFTGIRSSVHGGNESVFGTNTTSRKPADLWLEENGKVTLLYEVTLKKVDLKRLDDLVESTRAAGQGHLPVTFICRLPEDVSTLTTLAANTLDHKGRKIEFVDYTAFVRSSLALMSLDAAQAIQDAMRAFVGKTTTSLKTKNVWNAVFDD